MCVCAHVFTCFPVCVCVCVCVCGQVCGQVGEWVTGCQVRTPFCCLLDRISISISTCIFIITQVLMLVTAGQNFTACGRLTQKTIYW